MEMHGERRNKPETNAEKRPCKSHQSGGRRAIVKFRVQGEQAAAKKASECQAKEEKNTLEIALPAMPQDHNHPEKGEQSSSRENDESEVKERAHENVVASLTLEK